MAGTINLNLSQQFDITNGRLLSGGRLYTYASATSTPQSVYQDYNLTLPYPNPIVLGSDGRIPAFYVADGTIRARLVNSAGVVQFDSDSLLVVGPSSGSGGGASIDATTIFQTGDELFVKVAGTRTGWVRQNGRTIGSAVSGAAERANADTSALFSYLWNNFTDAQCPVSTGRGANAAADFAANKTITLPDMRGRGVFGLDDMGNSAASRLANALFSGSDTATTAGGLGGEPAHTLQSTEQASMSVSGTIASNVLVTDVSASTFQLTHPAGVVPDDVLQTLTVTKGAVSVSATASGGGGTHNNMPPFALGTWYIKL